MYVIFADLQEISEALLGAKALYDYLSGTAWGDLEHPMQIIRRCPICNYHSAAKPQEVRLS